MNGHKTFHFSACQKSLHTLYYHGSTFFGHEPSKAGALRMFNPTRPLIMTASICMKNGVLSLTQSGDCLFQHGVHQCCIRTAADCPIYNQTVKEVDDWRKVQLAFRKSEFRNICQPFFIWVVRMEVSIYNILYCRRIFHLSKNCILLFCLKDNQIFVFHNFPDYFF